MPSYFLLPSFLYHLLDPLCCLKGIPLRFPFHLSLSLSFCLCSFLPYINSISFNMTAFCDGNYYYRRHHHHDYYFYFYYYYLFVIDNSRNERKDRERRQKTQKRQKEDKTNHNGCRRRRGGGNTMEIQWCDGVVIVVVMVTHSKREKQQWTTILVSLFVPVCTRSELNWIEHKLAGQKTESQKPIKWKCSVRWNDFKIKSSEVRQQAAGKEPLFLSN